jgi:hypothetical protein
MRTAQTAAVACVFGDLISYRNGGKRMRAIAEEAGRTVSEYA